jgi:hypothetical protein
VYKVKIGSKTAKKLMSSRFGENIGELITGCNKTNIEGA